MPKKKNMLKHLSVNAKPQGRPHLNKQLTIIPGKINLNNLPGILLLFLFAFTSLFVKSQQFYGINGWMPANLGGNNIGGALDNLWSARALPLSASNKVHQIGL